MHPPTATLFGWVTGIAGKTQKVAYGLVSCIFFTVQSTGVKKIKWNYN